MSKLNKPFEQHIESNEFNINPLVDDGIYIPDHVLQTHLDEWFAQLPHPMSNEQWDGDLDAMQKKLRHNLANEILDRGLLGEFAEQLGHIDNETLTLLLQYPITIAMLSQDHFRNNGYPYSWENPDAGEYMPAQVETSPPLSAQIQSWLMKQFNRMKQSLQAIALKLKKPRI